MTGAAGGGATLVIGQRVGAEHAAAYRGWQQRVDSTVARFAGFRSAQLQPPTDTQPDWLVTYVFDTVGHLQSWLNSTARLDLLDEAKPLFDGPGTVQVIAGGRQQPETLVTVVITHRVAADRVEAFLAWQRRVDDAESGFPGFRGSEVFRPIAGVQDEWTISYRFDTAEHLDAWLTSTERQDLLREADEFGDYTLSRIDHAFGNWFSVGDDTERPSDLKTSVAVWMGLYPTVVLLTLLTAPLGMPLWLGLLVGNLLSSFVMTYVIMPRYVNPVLGWWLTPRAGAPQPATDVRGFLLVCAVNAVWVVAFYLITVQFWSLP